MMRYLLPAAAALAIFGASPALAAGCDLTASTSGAGLQKLYDPFSPQNMVVDLRLTVTNGGDQPCLARFFVAPLDGRLEVSAGGQSLSYRIEGAGSGAGPGAYGPFSVNVPAGGSEILTIQFTVLAQQVVPVGFYTGNLTFRGEDGTSAPILIGGTTPVMTLAVPARSETSISGAPSPSLSSLGMAPATINFPNATTGQTGRVFVNVWANSSVLVRLTSENGGVLRHLENPALPPIDYLATFDGASIGLASVHAVGRTPPMSAIGASYPLEITLGDTSRSFAGLYRDRITVDVTSN